MRKGSEGNVSLEKSYAFALGAVSLSRKFPAKREFQLSISPMGPIRPIGLMFFTHKVTSL